MARPRRNVQPSTVGVADSVTPDMEQAEINVVEVEKTEQQATKVRELKVTNHTRSKLMFPVANLILKSGESAVINFDNEAKLNKFMTDVEQLNLLNDGGIIVE